MNKVLPLQPQPPEIIETPTYRKIRFALRDCHDDGYLATICGGVGLGKTFTLEGYAAEHGDSTTIVTLDPTTRSLTAGLAATYTAFAELRAQGLSRNARTPALPSNLSNAYKIRRELEEIAALTRKRCGPLLLIVDEAQYARPDLLGALRAMYDRGLFGLVVSGNAHLFNPRRGRSEPVDFDALRSRARHRLDISAATAGDVKAVADAYGITGADEQELLKRCAAGGGVREVVHVIKKARDIAAGRPLGLKDLKAAAGSTGFSAIDHRRQR